MMRLVKTLVLGAALIMPAVAVAQNAPPAAVYDSEPFSSGVYFSSVPCIETFACDEYISPEQYIAGGDHCAASRLGYPQGIMQYFEPDGVYKNCVLPGTFAPKGERLGANAQWPVCCIDEVVGAPGQCRFTCHSYISG